MSNGSLENKTMKKLALTALAAAFATIGLASVASADSRSGDDEWRRHGRHDDAGRRDDRRGDDRQAHRDRGRDEWRHGDRRPHWRHHHRHAPRFVYRHHERDYCFVKKVRRYDDWGNMYIKRVRVCR